MAEPDEEIVRMSDLTPEQLAEVEAANAKIMKHVDQGLLAIIDQVLQGQKVSKSVSTLSVLLAKGVHVVSLETGQPVGEIWLDLSNFIVMQAVNYDKARVLSQVKTEGNA